MARRGARNHAALAVAALVAGLTQAEAAKAANVGLRTLVRWLREPEFRDQLEGARRAAFEQAADKATSRVERALGTLETLLDSELDFAKLGAARAIVEAAVRLREIATLAERVAALEARVMDRRNA